MVVVTWAVLGGLEAKPGDSQTPLSSFAWGIERTCLRYIIYQYTDDLKYHTRVPRFEYNTRLIQVFESGINFGLVYTVMQHGSSTQIELPT